MDEQNEVPESHCVEAPTCLEADGRYRSINGSCNNLANPRWGTVGEPFIPFTDKSKLNFAFEQIVSVVKRKSLRGEHFPTKFYEIAPYGSSFT